MEMNAYQKQYKTLHHFHGLQPFFKKRHCQRLIGQQYTEFVSEFYQMQISEDHPPVFAVPDGCIDILFECDQHNPQARICGSTLHSQHVELKENIPYFGVRFLPGVIPKFIGISATDLINQSINFYDLVENNENLVERIVYADSIDEKINIFFLSVSSQLKRDFSYITESIIHYIIQQNGEGKIKDLEKITGYSSRHIQRIFKQDIGMSIKTFACIMRFQAAIHALDHPTTPKLAHLTYELGYNDQAHFHKEFKKFSDMAPTDFIKFITKLN